tara:strand:- start:335 stop:841 length:507 start_codon:yes stop_codon:yes gene_type:complete
MIDMNQYKTCVDLFIHHSIPGKTKQEITEKWLRQVNDYKKSFIWMETYFQQYDVIYRIRPDLTIEKNLINFPNEIEDNTLYCFQQKNYTNQINDKFFFGNFNCMKKIMVNMIDSLKDENLQQITVLPFNVEQYFFRYSKYLNMKLKFISKKDFFMKKILKDKKVSAGF